ncbi:hypothetical protein [Effusibacillus lacus]|uniref:hypothetical protein n=1 Tax=Effusibacillus lacus TaxID=1348429 RepID=UPI000BB6A5B9|nr:hypothetical protein [Effusibacillus lacus]TCS72057.1 hypothetical protein EDD64_12352 [Effusibacillus lacus]
MNFNIYEWEKLMEFQKVEMNRKLSRAWMFQPAGGEVQQPQTKEKEKSIEVCSSNVCCTC